MKKIILTLLACFFLTGCSLIPKINFDTPNTIPQTIDKSKAKNLCKGEAKFNELGDIIYCSKGYYIYEESYGKKERRMTVVERIKSFINNLAGWSFWILLALLIFCPSVIGLIIGRTFNGFKTALTSTVRAISRAKRNGGNFTEELRAEHSKNKEVKKIINEIRAKVD